MDQAASLLELQRLDLEIAHGKKRLGELPEKAAILEIRHKLRDVSALRHKADVLVGKLNADLKAHQDEIESLTGQDRCRAGQGHVHDRPPAGRLADARDGRPEASPRQARDGVARAHGPHREGHRSACDHRRRDRAADRRRRPQRSSSTRRSAARCRPRPPAWRPSARSSPVRGRRHAGRLRGRCARARAAWASVSSRATRARRAGCRCPLRASASWSRAPTSPVCPHCHRLIVVRSGDE